MPNPIPESEVIESAYEDQIKTLYKNLVGALSDGGGAPGPGAEQECLQHFTLGLTLAKRARDLALSATATNSSPTRAASRLKAASRRPKTPARRSRGA